MSDRRSPDRFDRPDRPTSFPGEISRTISTTETAPPDNSPKISRRRALGAAAAAAVAGFVARDPKSVGDAFNRISHQDAPPPAQEFKSVEFEMEKAMHESFGKGLHVVEHRMEGRTDNSYEFTDTPDIVTWASNYKPVVIFSPTAPGIETPFYTNEGNKPLPGNNEIIAFLTPYCNTEEFLRINQHNAKVDQVELRFGGEYRYYLLGSDGMMLDVEQPSIIVVLLDPAPQIAPNNTLGSALGSLWGSPVDSQRQPINPATGKQLPNGQRYYIPLAPYLGLPKPQDA